MHHARGGLDHTKFCAVNKRVFEYQHLQNLVVERDKHITVDRHIRIITYIQLLDYLAL